MEIRGAIQLLHRFVEHLRRPEKPLWHYSFAVFRRQHRWFGVPAVNLLGRAFASQGIVPADDRYAIYVGVAGRAQKVAAQQNYPAMRITLVSHFPERGGSTTLLLQLMVFFQSRGTACRRWRNPMAVGGNFP